MQNFGELHKKASHERTQDVADARLSYRLARGQFALLSRHHTPSGYTLQDHFIKIDRSASAPSRTSDVTTMLLDDGEVRRQDRAYAEENRVREKGGKQARCRPRRSLQAHEARIASGAGSRQVPSKRRQQPNVFVGRPQISLLRRIEKQRVRLRIGSLSSANAWACARV